MFKKPTCPYCKAIYTSDEIKKQYNNEKVKCHNCKKVFVVKKNGGLVLLMAMAVLLAILINIFMMSVIGVRSVIPMFIVTIIIIVVALLMRSFFVKYKKEDYKK